MSRPTTPGGSHVTTFDLAIPGDIRFGAGRVAEVPAVFAALGVRRVLVVTGASAGRAEPLRADLADVGIASTGWAVVGEPSVDAIRDGVATLREAGCQGVLGFGGGSAIDAAKALAALAASGTDPLDHLEVVGAGQPLSVPSLPCVAVPTTAGTGSEVTRNSVLAAGKVKASLRSPFMLPRVSIVDPDLLAALPPAVIAASGSDALSQLIEPFLSARANPVTDALAREGIARSVAALPRAVRDGLEADPQGREDLALASLFGGLCLANSGLGAVHGFAAVLGARYNAPHGAVCGALLPAVVGVNLQALRERTPASPTIGRVGQLAAWLTGRDGARAEDASGWLRALADDIAIPGLSHYGVRESDFAELIPAARQASSMKANPIALTDDELTAILTRSC